jgi:hypothetical protein
MGSDLDVENRWCGAGTGGARTSGQTRGYKVLSTDTQGGGWRFPYFGLGVGNGGELQEVGAFVDFADLGVSVEFLRVVLDEDRYSEWKMPQTGVSWKWDSL